jgi:hypothetical protein
MAPLRGLTDLKVLVLDNPELTDQALAHLSGMVNLSEITLDATRITDSGLMSLAGLPNLRAVTLEIRANPGDCVKSLVTGRDLYDVCWSRSKVTATGIAALQHKAPRLRVLR